MIEKDPGRYGVKTRTISRLWPEEEKGTTADEQTVRRMIDSDIRGD